MNETDDFMTSFLPRLVVAEKALHNGNSQPRARLWTRSDPVTLFGASGSCNSGWTDVSNTVAWLAPRFAAGLDYRLDVVAVDVVGDLAYTVGFERSVQTLDGAPAERVLRVTQVYRLEDGDWRVVHRHGDIRPTDRSPHAGALPATTSIAAPPG